MNAPHPRSLRCASACSKACECAGWHPRRRPPTSGPCAGLPPTWVGLRTPPPSKTYATSSCTWWTRAPQPLPPFDLQSWRAMTRKPSEPEGHPVGKGWVKPGSGAC